MKPNPKVAHLRLIQDEVEACTACALHKSRSKTVFGRGNPNGPYMILGEAPGQNEDETGQPFVGRAGQLLESMLSEAGIDLKKVYILNTLKCRPPNNRRPEREELAACAPFLEAQIETITPKVIVGMGATAASALKLHNGGIWVGIRKQFLGFTALATYHPAYVLRNPAVRQTVVMHLKSSMGDALR